MSKPMSVLVVEDDEELRAIFQRRLVRLGCSVTAVENPQCAVDAADGQSFDVAVIDRSLPAPGGIALIEDLKCRRPGLRIVLMSGSPAEEWVAGAAKLGVAACLMKPFSLRELDAAVFTTETALGST